MYYVISVTDDQDQQSWKVQSGFFQTIEVARQFCRRKAKEIYNRTQFCCIVEAIEVAYTDPCTTDVAFASVKSEE